MRILIDIGHPAHVHLFKNAANKLMDNGHKILFTCRDKEFEIDLLEKYGFEYKSFGKKYSSKLHKFFGLFEFDFKEFVHGFQFKPDLLLSHGSIYAAHASFLLNRPHISFEDTYNFEQIRLYRPFTKIILTGNYEHPALGKKEIRYAGYHELAYLHPSYFVPDKSTTNLLNINVDEQYVIIRFVAWNATHDFGHEGISYKNKLKAIKEFEKYAQVFISSESELPEELKQYQIKIPPYSMHDILSFANLLWAESFTMPAECSVLGTPSIIINNTKSYYLFEQEQKYGLCFNYTESEEDQQKAINKAVELLTTHDIKSKWQEKRKKMLSEKIDVTAFMVWFIENYPNSLKVMKENPDYQYNFR